MLTHKELHPSYVDGCYQCKIATVSVAPSAMETRGGAAVSTINRKERDLSKDLEAYKRLRDDGLQPRAIDGSARLEKSDINSQFDIDLGRVVPKAEESRVRESFDYCRENGLME